MDNGYVRLHRKMMEWEWYSDANTTRLFLHCLLKANWKDGRFKGMEIKRGQFATSLPTLAKELKLSIQQIRTALEHLKSTGEITDLREGNFRIITIKNYCTYQEDNRPNNSPSTDNQQTNNIPSTDLQQTSNRPSTVIEKRKKEEESKKEEKEEKGKKEIVESSEPKDVSEPPVATLPLNDGTEYPVYQSQVEEWEELYPNTDVPRQLKLMRQWCYNNPSKRKTKSGVRRFITTWLGKEQDRYHPSPNQRAPNQGVQFFDAWKEQFGGDPFQ